MSGPYFQKRAWQAFIYQGTTYDLNHLVEYVVEATDSKGKVRRIAVTFSDHCFTKDAAKEDDPALIYPQSTRPVGHFCVERYHNSLDLRAHIARAIQGKVWNLGRDSYATIPIIIHGGIKVFYGVVFSLDRVKGLPVDLRLQVKTAHPRVERDIVTFGEIRFSHLVTLRMEGKSPRRNTNRNRKRPKTT